MSSTIMDKLLEFMAEEQNHAQASERPPEEVLASAAVEETVILSDEQCQPQLKDAPPKEVIAKEEVKLVIDEQGKPQQVKTAQQE